MEYNVDRGYEIVVNEKVLYFSCRKLITNFKNLAETLFND